MESKQIYFPACVVLGLVLPASADVIYSNLQDLNIPATFDGLYLDVNLPYTSGNSNTSMASPAAGWDINPFYGGRFVQNSPGFQPVRSTQSNTSAIVDLAAGIGVGSGSTYSSFTWDHDNNPGTAQVPGYGSSQMLTTSGGNFTAGTEGYLGFKLYTDATYTTANYGWMRVVFTNNTGGAVIRDWAYDNTSGAAIVVGGVQQNAADAPVTLNSAFGSFTLGSQVGGSNSVVKTGANSVTLTGSNNYSGITTVQQGTLALGATGSIAHSTQIIVGDSVAHNSAVLDVSGLSGGFTVGSGQTLSGSGSITGSVTVNGGTLAPGNSIESLAVTGDLTLKNTIFAYEMDSSVDRAVGADLQKATGNLTLDTSSGGKVHLTLSNLSPSAFALGTTLSLFSYMNANDWNSGFFTYDAPGGAPDVLLDNGKQFSDGTNTWQISYGATAGGFNFAGDYNNIANGRFINLTAIPEPGSLLALGCLAGSGALLRSRRRGIEDRG